MEKRIKLGEVVWAKIRGFPWWPGIIAKIEESESCDQETQILINFIGDSTHAKVQISKIEKFEEKLAKFSKTKQQRLQNSIILAKKIIKGEVNYKKHLKFREFISNQNQESSALDKEEDNETEEKVMVKKTLLNQKRHRGKKKRRRIISNISHLTEDIIKDLEQKIEELIFYKVTHPLSTSNASILSNLESIFLLIEKIEIEKIRLESLRQLFQFLDCLMTNQNSSIGFKSEELVNLIKKKFLGSLFDCTQIIKTLGKSTFLENEKEFILNSIIKLSGQVSHTRSLSIKDESTNNLSIKELKRKDNSSTNDYLCQTTLSNHVIIQTSSSQEMYMNKMVEKNSVSDISINSSKTDCEETRQKNKIKIFPLKASMAFEILRRYLGEDNSPGLKPQQVENENLEIWIKGKLVKCMNERNLTSVRYPYMRRRVCCKLFIVLEILLKNLNIDQEVMKHLSIYLESRARNEDPEMGKRYRDNISEIFTTIKEKLFPSYLHEADKKEK